MSAEASSLPFSNAAAFDGVTAGKDQVLKAHPVDRLITIDAPNVGYPGETIDWPRAI